MGFIRRIFGLEPSSEHNNTATPEGLIEPIAPPKTDNAEVTTKILDDGRTQKLPELESATLDKERGGRFTVGQSTHTGQVRTNNQDSIATFVTSSESAEVLPHVGVFVVADGMGGHHNGELASAVASRTVMRHILEHVMISILNKEENSDERPTISDILREGVQEANRQVSSQVPEGGTTITAAVLMGDLAYIAHVGDSRAYVINSETIEHITRDHSLVQRLIELEQLTPEEARDHHQKNVLYRALGQNDNIDVDIITRRLGAGVRLLLCSDGLWNLLPDEDIRHVVSASPNPQLACETLVKLANDRGGHDNISVVLVKMPG